MLALTKKTGYALVAMSYLSQLDRGRLASAREIAGMFAIPISLLMNVLKELAAAGYVESVRGSHGGYRLAIDPGRITLADVLEILEGPVRLSECITEAAGDDAECTCRIMASCPVADPVHRVHRKLKDFLSKVTLEEIVNPAPRPVGSKGS